MILETERQRQATASREILAHEDRGLQEKALNHDVFPKTIALVLTLAAFVAPNTMAGITMTLGLILLIWFVAMLRDPPQWYKGLADNVMLWPTAALVAILLLGVVISEDRRRAWDELVSHWYLLVPLVVPWSLRRSGVEHGWKRILAFSLMGATMASLQGWLQHFGWFGVARLARSDGNYQVIAYSQHMCMAFLLSIFLFLQETGKGGKGLLILSAFSLLGAILYSASRGPWIALSVALLFWTALATDMQKMLRLALAMSVVCTSLYHLHAGFQQRIDDAFYEFHQGPSRSSVGTRLVHMQGCMIIWREHPLFGTGTGDYSHDILRLSKNHHGKRLIKRVKNRSHAHNMYLDWLARSGLAGLSALLAFFIRLWIAGWNLRKLGQRQRSNAGMSLLVFFMVAGIWEHSFGRSEILFMFLLLISVLLAPALVKRNIPATQTPRPRSPASPGCPMATADDSAHPDRQA